MAICNTQIESIVIPEVRSNAVYSSEQWAKFLESVRASGILYRPCCRQLQDGSLELVDGYHRLKAWKELGHQDIEVEVEVMDDLQAMTKHLAANHHRGEADPVGMGRVVKKMHVAGRSYEDIGKVLGYSASTVSKYEGLLALPDFIQQALSEQRIKIGHVQQYARLDDDADITACYQFSVTFGWSVDVTKNWVDQRIAERQQVYATPEANMGSPLMPPAPTPELAQNRQCLCCGQYDKAEQTVFWQMCHGCADSLRYLKTVAKEPWEGLNLILQQHQQLLEANQELEKKLRELEQEIVAHARRTVFQQAGIPPPAWKQAVQGVPDNSGKTV